ncbi:unnamed protein product [Brachionus calyciflorus]|uniref:Uncharacterized protein n=1 Tax=Brachionus calyciflorus TaxID=104777 RepID=A0A814ALA3_9BILA|nr:unnamed protein product [Brachionus calyciflorus]
MKITHQLLAENGIIPTKDYLNLSNLNIAEIENLEQSHNIKHLILRNNEIDILTGLEKVRQLWRFEASNNRIKNLEGFSKFVALGTLNLHGNEFNWSELEKIRHLHIVDLITSNNIKFDKDPHYRKHLIDSLPNVWMIDGLLVTNAERQEVALFFEESAKSAKPIRHKLPKYQFVPTDQKRRDTYGDWSTKLMSKFAVNEVHNIETDSRRLDFIADWFEEIIKADCVYASKKFNIQLKNQIVMKNFLRNLIEFRRTHTEMCNMILVLLVASLQFRIPNEFLSETLNYTNLNKINETNEETIKLFELPRISRIYVSNLLLSAIKIDRDQGLETGFYENLFVALRNILNEIFREVNSKVNIFDDLFEEDTENYYENQEFYNQAMKSQTLKENKSLLSTEIIQLFCIVPSFYDFLGNSEGLIEILNLSIGDSRMYLAIESLLEDAKRQNKTKVQICEDLGSFITNLLKLNARQLLNKKSKKKNSRPQPSLPLIPKEQSNEYLDIHGKMAQIQNIIQPPRSAIKSASTIRSIPSASRATRLHSPVNANNTINEDYKKLPTVDDMVIIGRKKIGKVFKIDKDDLVEVKFDTTVILNELSDYINPKEYSLIVDLKNFQWDFSKNIWRPTKSTGEINTLQLECDIKSFLLKPEIDPLLTSRLNNSINLTLFNQIENIASETEIVNNLKSTIIDSHRSIVTVNLIEKNENKIENQSEGSSSNNTRPVAGKMVHFMLDFENSSMGQLSAKTNKSIPSIQPILNHQTTAPSKNFPGNKLTCIPNIRSSSISSRSSVLTNKKIQELNKTPRTFEFVDKWNEDEFVQSERIENSIGKLNTPNSDPVKIINDNQISDDEGDKQINEMKIIIEPMNNEHLTNVLVDSIEITNHNEHEKTRKNSGNSRSGSPVFPKGPTSSTITLIQPTIHNLNILSIPQNVTINNIYYQTYQQSQETRQKKLIKLQDCTTWLNVPSSNNHQSYLSNKLQNKLNSGRSLNALMSRHDYNGRTIQQYFPGTKLLDANFNRVHLLLSRKTNRTNTNPKMPVLSSPSSKDHLFYKGLRPNGSVKCFNLTSKKMDILKCQ